MMNEWDKLLKGLAAAVGAVGGFFGGWNPMMTVLAVCICMDYATGVIVAFCGHSPKTEGGGISSAAGFRGLGRKIIILLVVMLAAMLDRVTGNAVFQTTVTAYYIANEGISIIENAVLMGVPVPDSMKNALEVMRENKNKTDNS